MGMAASQARYLALVARKSNCEYEGQQINQARTALSNQSANLFNQMLGLQVPVPPSTQDFTKTQYSYSDGLNNSTISDWHQLATPEEDYNYVVTHYYNTEVYKGSEKKMSDPQVQMNMVATVDQILAARNLVATAEAELANAKEANAEIKIIYDQAAKALREATIEAGKIESYATNLENATCTYDETSENYTVNVDGVDTVYTPYDKLLPEEQTNADSVVADLLANGVKITNKSALCFAPDGTFTYESSLLAASKINTPTALTTYSNVNAALLKTTIETSQAAYDAVKETYDETQQRVKDAESELESAVEVYNKLEHPSYIGNSELTPVGSLSEDQKAEIEQIIKDLKEEEIDAALLDCFSETGDYLGGIYQFKMAGNIYYTTYADLETSYNSGTGINNIDGQVKLPYYNASYVSTKIEETEKALLETDGAGRFVSVRFENDSITYSLNMETVTDEIAYQDAMNQYYYENAKYDKMIQDINAKTSIIQREDQQLELRLKQLDTEQNALSTEIDAVSKIVKDNVESSFKTFSG